MERCAPVFIQEIINGRVREMDSHTFIVTFNGNPKPEISWYCNDRLLQQTQTYQVIYLVVKTFTNYKNFGFDRCNTGAVFLTDESQRRQSNANCGAGFSKL